MHTTSKKAVIFNLQIAIVVNDFEMMATVSKVDKAVLISLPNPQYESIIEIHQHLKEIFMDDKDKKPELAIHASTQKSKTETKPTIRMNQWLNW